MRVKILTLALTSASALTHAAVNTFKGDSDAKAAITRPLLFVAILTSEPETPLRSAVRDSWLPWLANDPAVEYRFVGWDGEALTNESAAHGDVHTLAKPATLGEAEAWRSGWPAIPKEAALAARNISLTAEELAVLPVTLTDELDVAPSGGATDPGAACKKGCQTGLLSLAGLHLFLHSDARYFLRIDDDGMLCVPRLLEVCGDGDGGGGGGGGGGERAVGGSPPPNFFLLGPILTRSSAYFVAP